MPAALLAFPKLKEIERFGVDILKGILELVTDGEIIDAYEIEIHPTPDYPKSYPIVYETGGRIPMNIDWHVYPEGNCCLAVPIEEEIECRKGICLTRFIGTQVSGYFFNQTFRRRNGYFYRERSHGLLGSLEYYKELLVLKNLQYVYIALKIASGDQELKPTSKCFCGSDSKYHKCHQRAIRRLKSQTIDLVKYDLIRLKELLSKIK